MQRTHRIRRETSEYALSIIVEDDGDETEDVRTSFAPKKKKEMALDKTSGMPSITAGLTVRRDQTHKKENRGPLLERDEQDGCRSANR